MRLDGERYAPLKTSELAGGSACPTLGHGFSSRWGRRFRLPTANSFSVVITFGGPQAHDDSVEGAEVAHFVRTLANAKFAKQRRSHECVRHVGVFTTFGGATGWLIQR